jgi:hypothetical protein
LSCRSSACWRRSIAFGTSSSIRLVVARSRLNNLETKRAEKSKERHSPSVRSQRMPLRGQ